MSDEAEDFSSLARFGYQPVKSVHSQNELSVPIRVNFCPINFFHLDFHFFVIFLLIGISHVDYDV